MESLRQYRPLGIILKEDGNKHLKLLLIKTIHSLDNRQCALFLMVNYSYLVLVIYLT